MNVRYLALCLVLSQSFGCSTPEPEPFTYLQVTQMTDAEKASIYQEFEPLIVAAAGGSGVMVSEVVAVVPPGSAKLTHPGPVPWELQMPVIDTVTGGAWMARLGADHKRFVLDEIEGQPPLSNEEATLAFTIAAADSRVQESVNQAASLGYVVDKGAMTLLPSESCPIRCVDVRYIGFGNPDQGLYKAMSIIFAQVSLAEARVMTTRVFDFDPTTP